MKSIPIQSKKKCCGTCEYFAGAISAVNSNKTQVIFDHTERAMCLGKYYPNRYTAMHSCSDWHIWYALNACI